jgi:hypothetical protein
VCLPRIFLQPQGLCSLDLSTNRITVFRHVAFDEANFPFSASPRLTNDLDIFLQDDTSSATLMLAPLPAPRSLRGFIKRRDLTPQATPPAVALHGRSAAPPHHVSPVSPGLDMAVVD